jgi:hypothetical protein
MSGYWLIFLGFKLHLSSHFSITKLAIERHPDLKRKLVFTSFGSWKLSWNFCSLKTEVLGESLRTLFGSSGSSP